MVPPSIEDGYLWLMKNHITENMDEHS